MTLPVKKAASVILPVYNGAKTIKNCLESLFGTNYTDFEVIVVNDGSTDETLSIVKQYSCRVIDLQGNHGPSFARNAGIKQSCGEVLLFTDADCIVQKDWVKGMYEEYQKLKGVFKNAAIMGGRVIPNNNFVSKCAGYSGYYSFVHGHAIKEQKDLCSANLMISREVFDAVGGFDQDLQNGEDRDLILKSVSRGYRIFYNPFMSVVHDHHRSMIEFFTQQRKWGYGSGFVLESRYRKLRNLQPFLFIKNPYIYFLLLSVPISLVTAWRSVRVNFRYDQGVILCAPFVFMSKVCFRWGAAQWLYEQQKKAGIV